jgi:1,5-anhydro-D-fructose reductase (1,5-anhydro-D-mannitol-forming)
MATSSEDARVMVETASQAGVRLGVAYHLRWHAGHREMKALAEGGKLGELRHVRAQWAWPAPDDSNWRARPEVGRWWSLAGVGTHCLDLIRWFLVPSAGEVTQLEAVVSRSVWRGPHDETATVALRFESGATAEFTCSGGPLEYTPRDPYVGELEDFAESIRAGRSPAVDGEEGLRNVELLERASP